MQYHHPEKALAELPGGQEIGDELLAPFFGTDVETYREIKGAFVERSHRCARELLEDVRFARFVDRLPFEPGSTVVGLGDSLTDDSQSWLEILRHLLAEHRPDDGIELVNAGISGDTTSGLLGRFLDILEGDPAWVIILIGTNDAAFVREQEFGFRSVSESLPQVDQHVFPGHLADELRHLAEVRVAPRWFGWGGTFGDAGLDSGRRCHPYEARFA